MYNLTKKYEVYRVVQRADNQTPQTGLLNPYGLPVIIDGKVMTAYGKYIQAHDLMTGKFLWRSDFQGNFAFNGIIAAEGKIFGVSADDEFLHALDPQTGKELWKANTTGAADGLFVMNSVVYVVSSGNGKFYAFDAQTGQSIWELKSPDNASSNGNSFFTGNITGADGKIYVRTFLNLYCYKAAR